MDYRRASNLAEPLGRLLVNLVRKRHARAVNNLSWVFGNEKSLEEIHEIIQSVAVNFLRSAFECLMFGKLNDDEKKQYVRITGKEKLDAALQNGKGVIILTAHFGNFLILMSRLADEGYDVVLLVKEMKNKRVEGLLQRIRNEHGYKSLYVTSMKQSIKEALSALKKNQLVVLLSDQRNKRGVEVEFFGLKTKAPIGAVKLSLATGAPILPMFMIRKPDKLTHELHICDPIEISVTGDTAVDIASNTQKCMDVIESFVRRYPSQWMWFYNRWKKVLPERCVVHV